MSSNDKEQQFSHTVMPQDEQTKHNSGPGIHIPSNAGDIKEFSEVRKEDAKALNERMQGNKHQEADMATETKRGAHDLVDQSRQHLKNAADSVSKGAEQLKDKLNK